MPGFVPAAEVLLFRQKDRKPSDAPSGLMSGDGRQLSEGGPTRFSQTRSARESERPPVGQPAGVGSNEGMSRPVGRGIGALKHGESNFCLDSFSTWLSF